MNEYITYVEYTNLGGVVSNQTTFAKLERIAQRYLDAWTLNRLKHASVIIDEVKECLVDMIDKLYDADNDNNIASFSNGKISITYDNKKTFEQELYNIALLYLPVSIISGVVDYET